MISSTKIIHTGTTIELAVRELNNVKRKAFSDTAKFHHESNMHKRFKYTAYVELGFQDRKESYQKAKRKLKGHNDPLVWSGRSRDITLNTQDIRATATQKKTIARIIIHARALNFRHPDSSIDMRDEVERISEREVPQLTDFLGTRMDFHFSQLNETSTRGV